VERHDGLARPRPAGDLRGARVVPVGDAPLGRVQEDPPGREGFGEDVLEFVAAGDQRDPALRVGDGRPEVVDGPAAVGGPAHGHDVPPHLVRREPFREELQHLELVLGEQLRERLKLRFVDDGPHRGQRLVVDSQMLQHTVGELLEQQRGRLLRRLPHDGRELLDRGDVPHFEPLGRRVDGEHPLRRPGDGRIVLQHFQEEKGVTAVVRCEHHTPPVPGDPDRPDTRIPSLGQLLQMQPLVRVELGHAEPLELDHRVPHPLPDVLLQPFVLVEEPRGEGELRHWTPNLPEMPTQPPYSLSKLLTR
jgi:hypothetical protein